MTSVTTLKSAQSYADPEPQSEALIAAAGITIQRDSTSILDQVTLAIRRGEIVTLIGPNGSGKTTLVRVMVGLLHPDHGQVVAAPGLRIGYVPQYFHVDDTLPLSVTRFLRLGMHQSAEAIGAVLAEVGARQVRETPLQQVSGGELRRVLLARALLRHPDLLVLDEPAAGMDINGQSELYALVRELRDRRRCGVLLVSHELHLVMAASDQVVCLNRHVCCSGVPAAVSEHPEYLALFGRELPQSLGVYAHHHDHRHALSGEPIADEVPRPSETFGG